MAWEPVGFVYAIEAPAAGLVKIGWTGKKPTRRFKSLSASSPVPLSPIGLAVGTTEDERAAHALFVSERSHGEWFRMTEGVRLWCVSKLIPWAMAAECGFDPRCFVESEAERHDRVVRRARRWYDWAMERVVDAQLSSRAYPGFRRETERLMAYFGSRQDRLESLLVVDLAD